MFSYNFVQKFISVIVLTCFLVIISPGGTIYALATISEVTPIASPTNNTTPTYVFNSNATGSINYLGICNSLSSPNSVIGDNTIIFDIPLSEGSYTTCQISVDDGGGPGNILNVSPFIIDLTSPAVTLSGSAIDTIFSGATYTDSGASWTDNVDGTGDILTFNSGTLNTSVTGSYIVEYFYVDAAGNTGSVTRTINVIEPDVTAPVITLNGTTPETIAHGSTYTDLGATWTDNVDGTGTISAFNSGTLDTNSVGSYIVEYFYVDGAGNTGSVTRTINVTDQTAPAVTLSGSAIDTIFSGATYTDSGASWTDNVDGTGDILTFNSGTLNTSVTGSYIVEYFYVDAAGNTGSVTRTINVIEPDVTAPVITLNGTTPETIAHGSTYTDLGATWTDNVDGTGTISAFNSGTLDTNSVGSYIVEYFYVDGAGNTGSVTRTINVTDQTAPAVTLSGSAIDTIFSGATYTDSGASWTDNVDGTGDILTFNSGTLNTSVTGSYIVEYFYVDAAGNTGSVTRTINVIEPDVTAPVITLNGTTPETIAHGSTYTDLGATWTDNVDGTGTISAFNSGTLDTNSVGSYIVEYFYVDGAGNTGSVTRTINVTDQTAPAVTLSGSAIDTIFSGATYTDSGASWTDNVDGTGDILTFNSGTLNTSVTGSYIVEYFYVDAAGNTGSVTRTINVIEPDVTAPVITLNGTTPETIAHGSTYTDLGATWTDNVDGTGTISAFNSGTLDTNSVGSYIVEYFYVDGAGNTGSVTRTINVTDQTAPAVTLSGSAIDTIFSGATYTDSGASWTDNVDGTGDILTFNSGTLNTSVTGSYIVEYFYVDAAGNTGSVTRTINVIEPDVTAPVITLNGTTPETIAHGSTYTDLGATWTDNVDGTGTISAFNSGTLDTNSVGSYIVEYFYVDGAGNTGSVTRTINVTDQTAPVVSLNGIGIISLNIGTNYIDAGANWLDNVDGSGTLVASGTVNTGALGTYILTYTKTDAAGNTSSITRTVNIIDAIAPVITLIGSGNITVNIGSGYIDAGASWIDNVDGSGTLVASGTVNTGALGTYILTYIMTDAAGNIATPVTRTVTIASGALPVITLVGSGTQTISQGATYMNPGATAFDAEDGVIPVTSTGIVNTMLVGTYTITYTVTDSNSNIVTATRTINVVDTTSPVIVLVGATIINVVLSGSYTDSGANWIDNVDGSGVLIASGSVDTYTIGSYTLMYRYTDVAGNIGTTTRTVNIVNPILITPSTTIAGPSGGGGSSSYGMGTVSMGTTRNSDLLIPSIARLLRITPTQTNNSASDTPTQSSSSQADMPIHTVAEPITSYICPTIKELYNPDDNGIISVSEGEFTDDVRAMIMYRSPEGSEDSTNYSLRYLRNQSSGIVKNNEFYEGSRSITRAEFTKMLVRALSCHYTTSLTGSQFSDVGEHAWYTEYINFATSKGWVSGYSDGTFHPHDLITRGEAAKILAKAIQLETGIITDTSFIDVPESDGFAPYIYALKENNIIGGKSSRYYDMNSHISRNEVARIFHKTFLRKE